MNLRTNLSILLVIVFCGLSAFTQTTAINYQGRLTDGGTPANGAFQIQFKLFDAPSGGTQVGATIPDVAVTAVDGVFSTRIDFTANAFTGANRFIEIAVRHNSGESYTTLSPREQIASSPYAIRTLSAATADDAQKLGGVAASEYLTNSTGGASFVKNDTALQTGNFNISGNGTLGGTLQASMVKSQTGGNYGFTQTDGVTSISTYVGSASGVPGGWIGTSSNSPFFFFANGGQPKMTLLPSGNFGIGINNPSARLDVVGDALIRTTGTGGNIQFGTPAFESGMSIAGTNRADVRFDGTTLKLLAGMGTSAPTTTGIFINTLGNVGVGTATPNTRMTLSGGTTWTINGWTASMNMQNGGAIGWEANASGQRFGIGQTSGGLYFFRTNSAFGNTANPANYDLRISDSGNLIQPLTGNGAVKAAALVRVVRSGCTLGTCTTLAPTIVNCFNSISDSTTGTCGFTLLSPMNNSVDIDFGFPVNNRFISLTPGVGGGSASIFTFVGANRLTVLNGQSATSEFYIYVF